MPVLVSNRGYGILWDNTSFTRFGGLREWTAIPAGPAARRHRASRAASRAATTPAPASRSRSPRASDAAIDLEIAGGAKQPNLRIHPALPPEGPVSVRWEGFFVPETSGEHLFRLYSNGGIRMWVDGRLVADHWRQGWLPWYDLAKVALVKGRRHALKVEWWKDQGMETLRLAWKTPAAERAPPRCGRRWATASTTTSSTAPSSTASSPATAGSRARRR